MTVEAATFISELNAAYPAATDSKAEGDDHLRLLKAILQAQFPNFTAAAVTATCTDLNLLAGLASVGIGYINVPQVSKSVDYTLVLADQGKHILHPSADTTARAITIPANASVAFPVGTAITFVNQASAGVMTIAITTDTMRLAGSGTTGSRSLAANGLATAIKVTSTEWIINGTGLT